MGHLMRVGGSGRHNPVSKMAAARAKRHGACAVQGMEIPITGMAVGGVTED